MNAIKIASIAAGALALAKIAIAAIKKGASAKKWVKLQKTL